MSVKFRIIAVCMVVSSFAYAGGGGEYVDPYENPLTSLSARTEVTGRTLHALMHGLEERDGFNSAGNTPRFPRGFDFLEELRTRIRSNGRNIRVSINVGDKMGDGRPRDGVLEFQRSFPIKRTTWDRCSNANAIQGVYDLAGALSRATEFSDQVVADALYYRISIFTECDRGKEPPLSAERWNAIPPELQQYLRGISYFYKKEYLKAALEFDSITSSDSDYLAQMGSYLAGRSYHIAAQAKWDGRTSLSSLEKIDTGLLVASTDRFDAHIRGGGRFSYSAIGLKRRNAYLMGYSQQYKALFRSSVDFLLDSNEDSDADARLYALLYEAYLADYDLELAAYLVENGDRVLNHPHMKGMSSIVQFFHAVNAYKNGSVDESVALFEEVNLPASAPYLVEAAKSRNDLDRLRELYIRFVPEHSQPRYLASLNYQSEGRSAFISEENPSLTRNFALSHCSIEELERTFLDNLDHPGIEPVRDALFDVYIQREKFDRLNELIVAEYIDNGDYEHIRTAVRQIVQGEQLGTAYMNIGYYIDAVMSYPGYASRTAEFLSDLDPELFCDSNLRSTYGNAPYFYGKSIEQFDEDDRSVSEAKALHYAIQCDRVGRRGCWGPRPRSMPPALTLFQRLHRKYPDSEWTEKTPYYYD